MSKYFLDTEFLEGKQDKTFLGFKYGETKPTIDLISIGIVSNDGREYYAISKDFNLKEAWNRFDWKEHKSTHKEDEGKILNQKVYWIRENVLLPIYKEVISGDMRNRFEFSYSTMKWILKSYGKTNKQIAEEIKHFVANRPIGAKKEQWILDYDTKDVKFYGYYVDYDWVVFCQLFGTMNDLPKGFPMYCVDLKQEFDSLIERNIDNLEFWKRNQYFGKPNDLLHAMMMIKNGHPNYPKQENKHNALADAKWNKELHEFINKL